MSHPPLSVIITASGRADDFHTFLRSLRPAFGPRDEVVCVVPPDRADLHERLRLHSWVRVLDPSPGDQAARWSVGLAATTHPVVLLIDGDVMLSAHWFDGVAIAFTDPTVVAAGPRCHRSVGPQRAEVPPDALASVGAFKAYARQWRQEHRGQVTDVDRLGPVCVALRRNALERAGGLDAGLPYERLRDLGRLVLVHSALVAHVGSSRCALRPAPRVGGPLLSASLIVKDEEAVIARCLTALDGLADETVVYDTGSTDRTVEIAREHGARVIEGHWNDHFGDARNRSLAHCRGRWALVVDADEVVNGDVAALRDRLASARADVTAFFLTVENVTDAGTDSNLSIRLFRGGEAGYAGRLHELPCDGITGDVLFGPHATELTLIHSGYTLLSRAAKDKTGRNRRLARMAVQDSASDGDALVSLARSEYTAGNVEAVIDACRTGLAVCGARHIRVALLLLLVRACCQADRLAEANTALTDLRSLARKAATADQAEIELRFAEGDHEGVLALLRNLAEGTLDDSGNTVRRRSLVHFEIRSLALTGQVAEAADALRVCLRGGQLPLALSDIADVLELVGSGSGEIVDLVPEAGVWPLLHGATHAPTPLAEAVVDALWRRYPGDERLLGFATWLGTRLPLLPALEWSARLRQHGFARECTLLAVAAAADRPARDRVLAAAAAIEMFGDEAAMPLLTAALAAVTDEESEPVLEDLRHLAPGIAKAIELVPTG